ncbi:MAG: ABC transporter substrate-binding protein [Candidatus Rokubacteria bacterium]|nr:ABC transporter substrate-binding protein [Candidatus Rokubacteria bacterium]
MGRVLVVSGLIVAALAIATPGHAAGPLQQLQQYTDRLIAILEDPRLTGPDQRLARRAAARNAAEEMFDAAEAGRRALGIHWARLSAEEQQSFVRLFLELLERAYVTKVDLYGGQRVTYLGESVDGDHAVVRAKVLTKKGREVPADTKMVRRAERWLVYDVLVENIGLVANYRAQFDHIIRTSSYQELVRRLEKARGE